MDLLNSIEAKPKLIESLCGIKLHGCILIEETSAVNKPECKEAMALGKFLIADAASQAVATRAMQQFEHPKTMLEVGAGKGTKTLMFQSLANSM